MQSGGHADDGGGLPHQFPHGVLALIYVAVHLGQGAVVPDGAHQGKGNLVADALIHDAVGHRAGLHEGGDGAQPPHRVDGVNVVIVAVEVGLLGVDVLAQGGAQIAGLQVVGGQGVARHQAVDIAAPHQGGKGGPGVRVKGAGGAHHPQDVSVLPLVAEKLVELVIVDGVGGLPAAAGAEGEGLLVARLVGKTVGVDVDALGAVLRAAHHHRVPRLDVAELHNLNPPAPGHRHAVHAAVLRQHPPAVQMVVFRKQGGGVVSVGHDAVLLRRNQLYVRGLIQPQGGKIRGQVAG